MSRGGNERYCGLKLTIGNSLQFAVGVRLEVGFLEFAAPSHVTHMLNPFASPQADTSGQLSLSTGLDGRAARMAEIGQTFVSWEKLRPLYNLLLGIAALAAVLIADASLLLDMGALETMAAAAVAANVCFFAGHIVDCYATWLFGQVRWIRPVLFALGTFGSILVTLAVVFEIVLDNFKAFN